MSGDISDIMSYLPTAGNNKSIAVGFENVDALYPLRLILDDYRTKTNREQKENQKQTEKTLGNVEKAFKSFVTEYLKESPKVRQSNEKQLEKISKKLEKINEDQKTRKDTLKEEKDTLEVTKNFALRVLDGLMKVGDKHIQNAIKFGQIMVDTESSGVFLKNGFDELTSTAHNLGMTHEDLANHLKKTSPLIARLNGSMGNGLKSFESAISGIDDNLNLTNKERVSIFENVLSNLSPDQLMRMSQEQMNIEINKTAREMKMLSMATGKSVELINQENEAKARTLRENVWKRTHRQSYAVLKSLGITEDSELMDYIMSGGGKMTAGILTKMLNDPFMQRMLPMLTRNAMTNNLNSQTLASLYQQNAHLATFKSGYADRASFDPARMMASGASDLFQNTQFYEFYDFFKNTNLNGDMASQYFGTARADANNALGNYIGAGKAYNSFQADRLGALSGGQNGVSNVGLAGKNIFGAGSWFLNKWNELTGGGTLAALGYGAIEHNAEEIFKASVSEFKSAVRLFAATVGLQSFGGGIKNFATGGVKWQGIKNASGNLQNPLKFTPWKELGKVAKIGKVAGGIGSVAYAGIDAYDKYKNWDKITEEGKRSEAIGDGLGKLIGGVAGSIFGGPLGAMAGTYLGGKLGGWAGKGVGWLYDKFTGEPEIKQQSSTQIKTSSPESKTEMENTAVLKEIRDYMRINASNSQSLIDLTDENVKINENQLLYNKTKGEHQN